MKKIYILLSLILCLFITGCKKNKVDSIELNKEEIVLYVGDSDKLTYTCGPNNIDIDVIWTSSNDNIVTVDDGLIVAKDYGEAVITVTYTENENIKSSTKVNVIRRTYNLTYDFSGMDDNEVITYEENIGLDTLLIPSKDGYIFKGWYLDDNLVTSISSTINKDVTLIAKWEKIINYYDITYVLDNGSFSEEVVTTYEENVGLDILPIPIKEGYIFKGWYMDDNLITSISSNLNKDITLIAKWEKIINYYDITYVLDGGTFSEEVVTTYEENIGLDTLPIPIKDGYIFKGWHVDDNLITSISSTLNKDITLIAKWEKIIIYYDITYILDNGSFSEEVITTYEENVGLDTLPIPIKERHIFKGWYLDDNLVTSISSDVNKDVELVAKWEKIVEIFKITYVLNGGKFEGEVVKQYEGGVGLEILPIPTKAGYEFLGWFLNGELITAIDSTYYKNLTLSGRWQEVVTEDTLLAREIIKQINLLPYMVSYTDKEAIYNVKDIYEQSNDIVKELVTNSALLYEKIAIIEDIENNISEVTYILGEDLVQSKDELFELFFSDFYFYILGYHGHYYLESQGIYDIDDFLNLASNYDAGRGDMRAIGDVAGSYMLKKDINGILANQPETGFFGYCYQNGKYQDLLPFFIRFFAYWRIDEKYANTSNYGADMFAESWAPTVDIAKFFHYTDETSYVQTERMLDCFNNTANVVYGDLPTELYEGMVLPTNLKLRGYKFEGWYDNPDFEGDKIEVINDTSKKVILYAKWSVDQTMVDKDDAAMVDVYIYNLTTAPAKVNKTTVQYVSDMYNNLSSNAKTLVRNYSTLLKYELKYL